MRRRTSFMENNYMGYQDEISEQLSKHENLVVSVVKNMNIAIPAGLNEEDFISSGLTGLHKAIKSYDSKRGSFSMYARCKIHNEIIDDIRHFSIIPRSILDKRKKYLKAQMELENELNRFPTDEEMMRKLGVTDDNKYKKYVESLNYGIKLSLNDVFQSSSDEIEEYFVSKQENILDRIEQEEFKRYIISVLDTLPEKARQIVLLYFYKDYTYKKIAAVLDISESTVGETLNRTLAYLKIRFTKDQMI